MEQKNLLEQVFDINKNPRLNQLGYIDAQGIIRL